MKIVSKLNTMASFRSGFKIVRNNEIITLTPEEMSDFRYLDTAVNGQNSLLFLNDELDNKLIEIIKSMVNDEEICYEIWKKYEDCFAEESGWLERKTVKEYIDNYLNYTNID
ncbi:hypothetical protein [Thomasclavelia spiroformis]|uniref:hypothetical protein n=1 Tax=Thomasclavelia spiroformis TaxID=29348 RepID=UPI0024B17F74|nr:hypothetical protein [Thomasclavelia spiroformis]